MVALSVILFPPLLIAFLLVMERVEEPLRRPASPREVAEFLNTATAGRGRHARLVGHPARAVPLAPPQARPRHDRQPADGLKRPAPRAAARVRPATRSEEGRRRPPIG